MTAGLEREICRSPVGCCRGEAEVAIRYCPVVGKLVFVRHSKPVINPDLPRTHWSLSAEGRSLSIGLGERLGLGATADVVASTEPKAIETAELLASGSVRTDERLGEVGKPWYDDVQSHADAVVDYLSGKRLKNWEPQDMALERFSAVIEQTTGSSVVIVTHGTVLSLWLSNALEDFDAPTFWTRLTMPDAYTMDAASNRLVRVET